MKITHPLHTSILVTDLEKSALFYDNILGLPRVERLRNDPGIWYQIGSIQLHLIVNAAKSPFINHSEKWGKYPHTAFAVTNLDETKKHLIAHNLPFQMSASGRAALFIQDPDGNIIELSEGV